MTKKTHRFIGAYQLGQGTMRLDDAGLARQMRNVLKLEPGETVIIGDGAGREAHCRILGYQKDAVLLEGLSVGRNASEPALKTALYCALLKADHFELAAAKATEVGVADIVPITTVRTVKMGIRQDRVERIVREAAELAGRGTVPRVHEVAPLDQVFADASRNDVNYLFDISGAPFSPPPKNARTAGVFIGPEGGWDEQELALARDAGVRIASLGGLTLRAETAAIIASYLVAQGRKN